MAKPRTTPEAKATVAEKPPQPPTKYVVQRQFEPSEELVALLPDGMVLWHDLMTVETHGATQAIKAAVGTNDDARGGVYRAFPARSDTKIPVHVEQTIKINFGTNGAGKEQ